ncbi:uncharacterized protein FTOL_13849 [Fusarium torulosum]
MYESY